MTSPSRTRARIKIITPAPKPAPRKREESTLLARIRLAVGSRPDFLLTRINTGVFSAPANPKTRIRSAPNGFPDLIGTQLRRIMEHINIETNFSRYEKDQWFEFGQAIAIETKSRDGELSHDQMAWKKAFERVGGVYVLARTVQDAERALGPVPEWVTR